MRQLIKLNKNILVFSGDGLSGTLKKYMDKIEFPNNSALLIYEGWDDIAGKNFLAVSDSLTKIRNGDDFSDNEKDEIWRLVEENGFFEKRLMTYVIKILRTACNKREINQIGIFFHEIRHVQQFCYEKDAYDLLLNQKGNDPSIFDVEFERDAIIYSRDKLREIGFQESEIEFFLREVYPSRWQHFMVAKPMTIAEVISEAKRRLI